MHEDFPDRQQQHRFTPDADDPSDHDRLFDILRLLRFHGFRVSEADIWGDPKTPVLIHVEGWDEPLKDFALIREAVASGIHNPHTLVALYAGDLRNRWRWRHRHRHGRDAS